MDPKPSKKNLTGVVIFSPLSERDAPDFSSPVVARHMKGEAIKFTTMKRVGKSLFGQLENGNWVLAESGATIYVEMKK